MDIRDFIRRLNDTTNDVLQIIKTCSQEQLNFKQDESWSVSEILEHLFITDKVIYELISRPSSDINSSAEIIGNERMKKLMVEQRNQRRVIAPEIFKPKGEIKDLKTFEKSFFLNRERLKDDITTGKVLIDNRIHKHPFLNEMTITDWLNFTVHHSQRHIDQIKDILKNIDT
jgi:DinB superfamily